MTSPICPEISEANILGKMGPMGPKREEIPSVWRQPDRGLLLGHRSSFQLARLSISQTIKTIAGSRTGALSPTGFPNRIKVI